MKLCTIINIFNIPSDLKGIYTLKMDCFFYSLSINSAAFGDSLRLLIGDGLSEMDTTKSSAKFVTLYREGILSQRLAINPLPELMGSYRYFGEITPSGHKGALNPHGWSEGSATIKNAYNILFF